jgi:hypothetical protein
VAARVVVAETVARIKAQEQAGLKAAEVTAGAFATAGAARAVARDNAGAAGY